MKVINSFVGEYRWLSNYYPCEIEFDGDVYPSVEHAYQAAKTTDPQLRREIREASSPAAAKRLGRELYLPALWEARKLLVMYDLVARKFADPVLRAKLMLTGDATIIEGNWWGDAYWGKYKGVGHNHLGRIIMVVRDNIRSHLKEKTKHG